MFKQMTSLFLAGVMFVTLAGCSGGGGNQQAANTNYSGGSYGAASPRQQPAQGMSTKKKLVLLAGAAALAYLYNKHKNKQGVGPNGQYYRSKNGRIYYRDAKTKQAVWVTPPSQGVYVPQNEADIYQRQARDFEYSGSGGGAPGPRGY